MNMKMKIFLTAFLIVAYGVLLFAAIMVGRAQAADPVFFDAFSYQVETAGQVTTLQQALCREFRYEPNIFDPVYVAECAAYYGPDRIMPVVYPERISNDPFCEQPPAIVNPESCPDYANRKQVAWFDKVVEKHDTALKQRIETYIEQEKAAAAAGRGRTMIKAK